MSLSFPVSPTNGQQYQNWQWNSSVGAWVPNYAAGFVTSFNGRAGPVTMQPGDNTPGNLQLIRSQQIVTTAPVATLDFTGLAATNPLFDEYLFEIYGVQLSATGNFGFKLSTDNGATWNDGGNYYFNTYANTDSTNSGSASGWGATYNYALLAGPAAGLQFVNNAKLYLPLLGASGVTKYARWESSGQNANGVVQIRGGACLGNAVYAPVTAVRFAAVTSGTMTRGVFNLYGIVRATAWS